jgi:periplasmic divalent cation tolerance protein
VNQRSPKVGSSAKERTILKKIKMEKVNMNEKVVVLITVGSEEEAVKIAHALLEERLIACANIIPKIRSLYRWKGKLCDDQEGLMLLKTVRVHFPKIEERVRQLHSYEIPEVMAVTIQEGNESYFQWVEEETRR